MHYLRTAVLVCLCGIAALAAAGPALADGGDDDGGHHGRPCRHHQPDPNVIFGTPFADFIVGTRCNDVILAGRGRDRIIGGDGNDSLYGGRGRDRLWDVDGERDYLSGGRGIFDRCVGDQFDSFTACETVLVVQV